MHKRKIFRFPNAMEVHEYHTARYGAPGRKRQEKRKPTPEDIARQNRWNRERTARHKLRMHFKKSDYYTDLTYRKPERPEDMEAAKKDFAEFIRLVRKEYRKRGAELKWLRNIEVGTRGGWHIHIIVNRIDDTDKILTDAWKKGKVISQLMHNDGEFKKLAAYITKTPETDPRLREASYSSSRNLPLPEPEEKIMMRWRKEPHVPKGYYLDEVTEGINPVTGYSYRTYSLLCVRRE